MSRITTYREGVPCWTDLTTPDVTAGKQYYGELFGWKYEDTGEAGGGYQLATLHGLRVAGIGPRQPGDQAPPRWTAYLAADDVDQVATRIREAGGTVLMEPTDVTDQGRMAMAADPAGAAFGLWQGKSHGGSGLANEPGTFTWNENLSTDPATARSFYQQVFGYEYEAMPDMDYTVAKVAGNPVGGIGEQPSGVPAGAPSFWNTYFSVADTDRCCSRVVELGGRVEVEPFDTPYGRVAVVRDDLGAAFCLISQPEK
ncbi:MULTISPECIES: VOC family protein [Kitasatospora]|uniref:VOC family protein n=1 Tax=Kitasatospora cystarginea TaxID=58350 RepID=A0ABN3DE22_9ACTN